jgi:hypothetical protein
MVSETPDLNWAQLAEEDPAKREEQMAMRYREVATLADEERRAALKSMAHAEYALPDAKLHSFTVSRIRTWLALEPETAQVIARTYDSVMQSMPGPVAMRRVALVQTLVLEFTAEEEARLRELVPGVFAGAPSRLTGLERPANAPDEPPAAPASASKTDTPKKKPFWAFWRKD